MVAVEVTVLVEISVGASAPVFVGNTTAGEGVARVSVLVPVGIISIVGVAWAVDSRGFTTAVTSLFSVAVAMILAVGLGVLCGVWWVGTAWVTNVIVGESLMGDGLDGCSVFTACGTTTT